MMERPLLLSRQQEHVNQGHFQFIGKGQEEETTEFIKFSPFLYLYLISRSVYNTISSSTQTDKRSFFLS
jgi:hypothetical protein